MRVSRCYVEAKGRLRPRNFFVSYMAWVIPCHIFGAFMELELKFAILVKFKNQYNFARRLRIHETKLSQVLHGRRKLSKAEAQSWIKTLGCTPDLLDSVVRRCDP
jgi:hypothetical protein